jgi:hypothetical protein
MGEHGSRKRRNRWTVAVLSIAVLMLGPLGAFVFAETVTTADGKTHDWTVVKVTEVGILIKILDEHRLITWEQLEAKSAYGLRKRIAKEKDAADQLALARFCLARRLWEEARQAANTAKELDAKLTEEADRLIAQANGERTRPDLTPDELDAVLTEQRGRAQHIQDLVAQPVAFLETDHFIIYTTFPKGDHKLFKKIVEKLYKGFDGIFEISKKQDRMWDGKAIVYLFKEREEFVVFSNAEHNYPGEMAGGYFRAEGGECEIVIPRDGDLEDFLEVLVHEGAHAFLHFYRDLGHVPRWVHEGVAQYFQFDEFPKGRHARAAIRLVKNDLRRRQPVSLVDLARDDRPQTGLDFEGYAYAHSYVYFMVRVSGKKFATFIRSLKSGKEPEEALKEAYGWDVEDTQKKWAKAMVKALR